jgi:hypothetical protein
VDAGPLPASGTTQTANTALSGRADSQTEKEELMNHVCQCVYEWSDAELDELTDDDFEDLPCASCGGRVVDLPVPVWMAEEEDDC